MLGKELLAAAGLLICAQCTLATRQGKDAALPSAPKSRVLVGGGVGDFTAKSGGAKAEVDGEIYRIDAQFLRESRVEGGGLQVELVRSDSNPGGDADSYDIHPFAMAFLDGGSSASSRFRMPVSAGPFLSGVNLSAGNGSGSTSLDYFAYGVRAGVEPMIHLTQGQDGGAMLFCLAQGGVGFASAKLRDGSVRDRFTMTQTHYRLKGGLRFNRRGFTVEIGYQTGTQSFDDSVGDRFILNDSDYSIDGAFFMIGGTW